MERLQKLIARAGICSRRRAEELITSGRVAVDGQIVTELGAKADVHQKIRVDGKELTFGAEKIYLLVNKPRGYICTASDDRGRKTVLDLLGENFSERVYPVGRLDFDSEGLILLTNDGDLTNALIHPRYGVSKTYRVKISGDITADKLERLRAGIELDDGPTAPAEVHQFGADTVDITIREGRNRQVRRMFAAVGCNVKRLRRIRFAGLTLSGVPVGKFRALTADEVAALKKL
ncbi:MAG: rRNA pseudouridine synthase [Quinella sp. 2Q5]|nr:rRNA pseudouridine synthase [Quinella sp. 2Q5]